MRTRPVLAAAAVLGALCAAPPTASAKTVADLVRTQARAYTRARR